VLDRSRKAAANVKGQIPSVAQPILDRGTKQSASTPHDAVITASAFAFALLGGVGRIQMLWRFLFALWRHLRRRRYAGNASRSEQLPLDVILGFAREAVIELARLSEYQHFSAPHLFRKPNPA
jgi:hypothetical protein